MYLKSLLELPSSLMWCEGPKYSHSDYIAEFWNSVSGICLCISAIVFYINFNRTQYYSSLSNANNHLFIVGIGTILFHGTLLYVFQLFDEMPMLVITIEYLKIYSKLTNKPPHFLVKYKWLFITSIVSSYFIHPQLQVVSFLTVFAYSVYIVFFQLVELNKVLAWRRQISLVVILFITSIIIWAIDRLFCNKYEKYKLHAWWHVLTSIAIYYCNKIYISILIYHRNTFY
jgi:dihydroceramidase